MNEGGSLVERLSAMLESWDEREVSQGLQALASLSPAEKADVAIASLNIAGAGIEDFTAFSGLKALRELQLSDCTSLRSTVGVAALPGLRELTLSKCPRLETLRELSECAATLEECRFELCRSLEELGPIQGLTNLRALELSNVGNLPDLQAIVGLSRLRWIKIENFATIDELEDECDHSGHVTDLSPLRGMRELSTLHLCGQSRLSDLGPLAGMAQLDVLRVAGCSSLAILDPLSGLANLQSLDLTDCVSIEDLAPLSGLKKLRHLTLRGCRGVASLRPIHALHALEVLSIGGCEALDPTEVASLREAVPLCEVDSATL